jgi:hypothetical protein
MRELRFSEEPCRRLQDCGGAWNAIHREQVERLLFQTGDACSRLIL